MHVRAIEFYSGIGGLHLAFLRSGVEGSIIQAFDWDQNACKIYRANHSSDVDVTRRVDITRLDAKILTSLHADLWLMSPACQPYTVLNPTAKGASDPRAQSFLHLIQTVLPMMASTDSHPSHILIENVAGFETSETRKITITMLQSIGYTTAELLLTPLQFGIPNSRLRYYLLAKKQPLKFNEIQGNTESILYHIPGRCVDWHDYLTSSEIRPSPAIQIKSVRQYLDPEDVDMKHEFKVHDRVLERWGRLFDIVSPSSYRSCCFTRGYTQLVERTGSILQMNETVDTTEIFDKFLIAKANGDAKAVRMLDILRLRYFSPDELLRLFCFNSPSTEVNDGINLIFKWPKDISMKTKYRLIGNSVNVLVVKELITYLFLE